MKNKLILGLNLVLILIVVPPSRAGVLPNDAIVGGKTIGEWSAEWWKWVLPISTNQNPLLDMTGAWAAVGQPAGEVFFVPGTLGLDPAPRTRTFTVPEGKYLFVALNPYEADNVGSIPLSIEELRAQAAAIMDSTSELHASIDGVEIPDLFDHRAISPVFNLLYDNADNIHSFAFGRPVTGLIDPMICDGYWLMIEPLPPGPHVLRFGASLSNIFFFPIKVTNYITVVPASLPASVEALIQSVVASDLSAKLTRALNGLLSNAARAFEKDHVRPGINHLLAFQRRVGHEVGPMDPALAEQWIQAAQQTIDRASQEATSRHHEFNQRSK